MTQRLHRRLLAAGLIAGVTTVGLATGAQAATTVTAGPRQTVQATVVSPSALPATFETGTNRRTTTVTVTL